jgi:hypothetical protein
MLSSHLATSLRSKSCRNWSRQPFTKSSQRSGDVGRQKNRMLNKFQKYVLENAVLASNWSDKNRTIDAARNVKDHENSKSKKRPFVVGLDFHRLHEKAGKVFSRSRPSLTSRIRASIAHRLSGDSGAFTVAYPFILFQNDGLCFQIKGKTVRRHHKYYHMI